MKRVFCVSVFSCKIRQYKNALYREYFQNLSVIAEKKCAHYNDVHMETRKFIHTHRRKIVASAPIIFLLLLGSSGILSSGNTLSLIASDTAFVSTGDAVPVTLLISTKTPINAVGGTVTFPAENITIDSLSRASSIIDLWSEEPVTSNTQGTVRFSGGIVGPHVGANGNSGQIFTINFHALKEGKIVLHIKDGELLANDGSGANQISSTGALVLYIRPYGRVSPDVNGDGNLSLGDVNSLYLHTFKAYDEHYDINDDGKVDWTDVRMLISLL